MELDNYVIKLFLYTTFIDLLMSVCRCFVTGTLVFTGCSTMSIAILDTVGIFFRGGAGGGGVSRFHQDDIYAIHSI